MGRKIAMQLDSSFASWWGWARRHGPSHSSRPGGEPAPEPGRGEALILVLLLSLGLWALIWAAFSLLAACALQ
jgi:hypothetical protein